MGELTVRDQQLATVHSKLGKLLQSKMDALPSDFNETRFLQNCMTVLQDIDGIEKMEPQSVARTMLKGAFLGLDFFTRECYAIAYNKNLGSKNNPNWVKELQFQTDYKGEIKLAKKYSISPVTDLYAKVVRDGDEFEELVREGKPIINFRPKPFNDGEIIGAFAVVLYKDGSMQYDTMSKAQIEHTRDNFSKQKNGQAWSKSTGEMYKKTVLRRLCKLIELDFANQEQQEAFEDGSEFDVKSHSKPQKKKPQQATGGLDDVAEEAIDVEYTDVKEEVAEPEQMAGQTSMEDVINDSDLPFND